MKQATAKLDRVPGIWSKMTYVIYLKAFDSIPYIAIAMNAVPDSASIPRGASL
jgi:hypothetical protein